jgi:cytochrome c heme-lyase
MLQQDLLDTLFLNRKALAEVGGGETGGAGNDDHHTTEHTTTTTEGGSRSTTTVTALTMNKDMGGPDAAGGEDKCPVDHRSREAWMAQAKAAQEASSQTSSSSPTTTTPPPQQASKATTTSSTWQWPRIPFLSSSSTKTAEQQSPPPPHGASNSAKEDTNLDTNRVISTIPRSQSAGASTKNACPANNETETGADSKTGNWVYPSEKMFFDAMKRKGHDTRAGDMRTVVPIHNAVNERAWAEIRQWEMPYASSTYVFCHSHTHSVPPDEILLYCSKAREREEKKS